MVPTDAAQKRTTGARRDPVVVQLKRRLPHERGAAFAWLTDIQDSDVERAEGAVLAERRVIERGPDRVVYEGETAVLGRRARSTTEVKLHPPGRWEAHVIAGPRKGSWTDYEIVPADDGCALTVTYHFVFDDPRRMILLRLAKPIVKREIRKMWDGFARSMAAELPRAQR